jgi:hypothetical protein
MFILDIIFYKITKTLNNLCYLYLMKSKKYFRNKNNTVKLNESRKYNKSKLRRIRRYTQRGGNESQNNNLSEEQHNYALEYSNTDDYLNAIAFVKQMKDAEYPELPEGHKHAFEKKIIDSLNYFYIRNEESGITKQDITNVLTKTIEGVQLKSLDKTQVKKYIKGKQEQILKAARLLFVGFKEFIKNKKQEAEAKGDVLDDTIVRDIVKSTRSAATKGGKGMMNTSSYFDSGTLSVLGGVTKLTGKAYNKVVQTGKIKKKVIDILIKSGKIRADYDSLTSKEQEQELAKINIDEKVKQIKERYSELKLEGVPRMDKKTDTITKLERLDDEMIKVGLAATQEKAADTSSEARRKVASIKKDAKKYAGMLMGKDVDTCSLVTDKMSLELDPDRKSEVQRKTENHPFFREEDSFFKSIVNRNMQQFCFNKRVGNDDEYYSRFCRSILTCMKTPKLINSLLFEAVDAKATKRMFVDLPGSYDPGEDIKLLEEKVGMNLKKRIVKRIVEEHPEIKAEKDPKERFAMILSQLQNENKKSLAMFLVEVLIKSIIDYKESSTKAPKSYTGKIMLQEHVEKLIKRLTTNLEKTAEQKLDKKKGEISENKSKKLVEKAENTLQEDKAQTTQSGGGVSTKYTPMTLDKLKKVGVEELYEGMKRCRTKDLIKSEYEDSIENENLFQDGDIEIDGMAEGLESPKLLYIVIGSLALVSFIELGIFDAPDCLTHTLI